MIKQNGIWIPVNEKPSDLAQNGIPRKGDLVEVEYLSVPTNPTGCRRIGAIEDKKVFRAKQIGQTYLFAAI